MNIATVSRVRSDQSVSRVGGRPAAVRHRVLVVAPFAPSLRARHGGARALGGLVDAFSRRVPTAVLHVRADDDDVIDGDLGSGLEEVRSVALPPRRTRGGQLRGLTAGHPLWVQTWWGSELRHAIDEMIDRWRPDVVHVELDVMAPALAQIARRRIASVFTVHEPANAMATPPSRWPLLDTLDRRAWRLTEANAIAQATATVVFTERDSHLLAGRPRHLAVIPLGADTLAASVRRADTRSTGRGPGRPRVVFVGGGAHPPNVDAVRRIVHDILPRLIALRDDVGVVLIGTREGAPALTCPCPDTSCAHLTVLGDVDDVAPHLASADVVLAPLRLGGGMRVKVLDALAAGAAVVATSIALAGLDEVIELGAVRRADTDNEIARAVIELIDDPIARSELQRRAQCWVRGRAGWNVRIEDHLRLHEQVLDAVERGSMP